MMPNAAGKAPNRPRRRKDLILPLQQLQRDTSLAVNQPLPSAPSTINFCDLDRLSRIGWGTGGTVVYKVLHRPTKKLYALKLCHVYDHETSSKLACKARIFCNADHPNVLKCHDVFVSQHEVQILLEFMGEGSLKNVHVVDEPALSELARQILSGLSYLHKRDIAHREIKPSNLLVDSRKIVKIADFGTGYENEFVSSWTIEYMSPERINTDLSQGRYDRCAEDIWSFGVCILEFYFGKSPFDHARREGDWRGLMRAICMSEPPSAPETASGDFRNFIGCCLQRDPTRRWTAEKLLKHSFITRYSPQGSSSDVSS